jgi:hypothetical protein
MCLQRQPHDPARITGHFLSGSLLLAMILALLAMLLTAELAKAAEAPRLEQRVLSAAGRQATVVHTDGFGRYALWASSLQGTGLQLVDRMAGPGAVAGEAGRQDGRVDLFLDRGSYKLITHGHREASGDVQLEAHAFEELNTGLAPVLPELLLLESALGDLQQRSWWIEIDERERVILEAAGRYLADMRLWRDGSWLVEALPDCEPIQPREGQPLLRCQLSTVLEPGLYLLSAYGGPGQSWSEQSDARPLWLRSGIPSMGEAGRQRTTISPFGEDRFLVPGAADLVRLELPQAREAWVSVAPHSAERPFRTDGRGGQIREESVPPVTTVTTSRHDGWNLVTVRGAAEQPYVLQHFPQASANQGIEGHRPFWLSTLHAGATGDSLEPTSILVRRHHQSGAVEVVDAEVVDLDEGHAYQRRFELLEPATFFIRIDQPGTWAVELDDPKAQITVEPFFLTRPRHYQAPEPQLGSSRWELDAGYHVVSIRPHRLGVATMNIRPRGLFDTVLDAVGLDRGQEQRLARAGARFERLRLEQGWSYSLVSGQVPGVPMGLVQRDLPLDLSQSLPVPLAPGEQLEIEVELPERGVLRLEDDRGELLDIAPRSQTWMRQPELGAGRQQLILRNPGDQARVASLIFEPASRRPGRPLEPIGMHTLAMLPEFPLLTADQPLHFDLERDQRATFRLRVDEPALYVLESTGLLATRGSLRTRTVLSLATAAENGVGRNFLIQSYLGSGEYQVTVQARGRSRGHLGLRLRRTTLVDGGGLAHGVPARAAVPAGDGLTYSFIVAEQGPHEISAIGEQRGFRCRLEDGDGWPIERPGGQLPATRQLEPGDYRLVLLPEAVDTRRVTTVSPVAREIALEGHGPHELPLGRSVRHTWLEPQDGSERVADAWFFRLPATTTVSVGLGEEMAGEIFAHDDRPEGERVARVSPGQPWRGELAPGLYELRARAARRDHGLPYAVMVQPEALVVGTRRQLQAPTSLPVAVGQRGLIELASVGDRDVRARLYAADGSLIASSDDRPEDWNFQLVERLDPGLYSLKLDPVGSGSAHTTVMMSAPAERSVEPMRAGQERVLEPGEEVLLVPLTGLGVDGVVSLRASSAESVGLALEARLDGQWSQVAEDSGREALALARTGEVQAWRLRLWSMDRRGNPVQLKVREATTKRSTEARMVSGSSLGAGRQDLPSGAALRVGLDRPGLFAVSGDPVRWCPHPVQACEPIDNGLVAPGEAVLWLAAALREPGQQVSVRAHRVELGPEPSAPVALGRGDTVLADLRRDLPGPVFVRASAVAGQPGLRVVDRAGEPGEAWPEAGMAVGDRAAVAVALEARDPALVAWDADPDPSGGIELRLEAQAFTAPLPEAASPGGMDWTVPAGAARAWLLPGGSSLLRVSLTSGMVAVLEGDSGVQATLWAQDEATETSLRSDASRLVVLNPTAETGRVGLDLVSGVPADRSLGRGEPFERQSLRQGCFQLTVQPGEVGDTLHLRGLHEAILQDQQGRVHRGLDLTLPDQGGLLHACHDGGTTLAWIEPVGAVGAGLWGELPEPKLLDVATPALLPMRGPSAQLGFSPDTPVALHLHAPQALVVGVRHGEGPLRVSVYDAAEPVDLLLPGGPSAVLLRPLAEEALRGEIELSSSPVIGLGEGLGPELLLAPGDARFFSFELDREGPVGLGVRSDADTVSLVLLDEQGVELGRGLAQMPRLEPGTWLLALRLPPHATPVRAQPVVVGIELPDSGPPDDVIQRYLRLSAETDVEVQP